MPAKKAGGKTVGRTRLKRPVIPVPKSLVEAAKFVRKIGEAKRTMIEIQTNFNRTVETAKEEAMVAIQPHEAEVKELMDGLYGFAEANREELTKGGKDRTVSLPTGSFAWRLTPPSVLVRNVKAVLRNLKALDLGCFIRVKEEIDKAALLKEPKLALTIEGISITQREEFVVKPAQLEVELTRAEKLKRALPTK